VLLVITSLVTVTGVLMPGDARIPAIHGAAAVLVTGVASTFRWRDNWARLCFALNALNAEVRAHDARAAPDDDPHPSGAAGQSRERHRT
jgi:hypothetical protein